MKYSLFIYYLLFSSVSYCGTTDITTYLVKLNEIKQLQDSEARDTQLIWQYNYISEELARNIDPRTEAYLDTLRMMCDLTSWDNAMGFYYRAMGRSHDFKGNFSDALSYYDRAIEAFKPAGGDLKELAFTYVLKGFLLSNSEMYQACRKTLKEGIPYAQRTKYKNSLCLMLDWFGDYYYYGLQDTIDNELALDYYLQVNEILPLISYARIIADNHAVLSGLYTRLGKKTKSDYHFTLADSITKAENLHHVRWGLYSDKAIALEEQGKHKEANAIYLSAQEIMAASSNIEFKSRLEKALWTNYKHLGNYKLALVHYENMIAMEERMATDEVLKKYAEIEAKYSLSLKEKEIAELQKSKLRTNRNLVIGLFSVTLISFILIARKNRELRNNYKILASNQEEIERAIYTGETQERQRLSGELHDNVNTKLAAARWHLEAISEELSGSGKDVVDSTIEMLNDAYQDVRNISHNLVPAQLESEGLISSIENLLQKLNTKDHVNFNLVANNLDNSRIESIVYPLYNIIFELINNVIKHADASIAVIRISNNQDTLTLTVNDNGHGYNVEKIRYGFGLRSIESRVKALKGTMDVQSKTGEGTITSILIPIE